MKIDYGKVSQATESIKNSAEVNLKSYANREYKALINALLSCRGEYTDAMRKELETERQAVIAVADFMIRLQRMLKTSAASFRELDEAYKNGAAMGGTPVNVSAGFFRSSDHTLSKEADVNRYVGMSGSGMENDFPGIRDLLVHGGAAAGSDRDADPESWSRLEQMAEMAGRKQDGAVTGGAGKALLDIGEKVWKEVEEEINREKKSIPISQQKYYDNNKLLISKINAIDPNNMFSYDLYNFNKIYKENKEIYNELSQKTGVPPELIAAIHYRESGCNFNTYLHNGQNIGMPTTIEPKGRIFDDFSEAAIDALESIQNLSGICLNEDSSVTMMMTFAEVYNGTGYTDYRNVPSPYIYSGTDIYVSGKYVSDHTYDENAVDKQPGVYMLVMSVKEE